MTAPTEKQLDAALESALKERADFVQWLLAKTKFANRGAIYHWSRSDHPWGTIDFTSLDPETGLTGTSKKQCETDVLVVLLAEDGEFVALHIENKIGSGKFTESQPEMYKPRAEQWRGKPKYKSYTDFQTVLIAPHEFWERNQKQASCFDCFISHEEIAPFIPMFGEARNDAQKAIQAAEGLSAEPAV